MIEAGTKVKVHYKGTLEDGSVFDSSENRDPLEFQLGAGQVIAGFDAAVSEMEIGGTKTVTIPSTQAYGEYRKEMVLTLEHSQFPEGMNPEVGKSLQLTTPQGPLIAQITEISDDGVTIDAVRVACHSGPPTVPSAIVPCQGSAEGTCEAAAEGRHDALPERRGQRLDLTCLRAFALGQRPQSPRNATLLGEHEVECRPHNETECHPDGQPKHLTGHVRSPPS